MKSYCCDEEWPCDDCRINKKVRQGRTLSKRERLIVSNREMEALVAEVLNMLSWDNEGCQRRHSA